MTTATTRNAPGRIFSAAFAEIENTVEFDPSWKNGTGYFDNATKFPMQPGVLAKTLDEHNRRLILIGTRFGTVVVFDRFRGQTDGGVYVANRPESATLRTLMSGSEIGEGEMCLLLGGWGILEDNIGNAIEQMAAEFK